MAVLLAALSAATFGIGDFFGGLSARRMAALLTTVTAQATGLVLILAACLVISGDPSGGDLALGAAAGLAGAVGLVLATVVAMPEHLFHPSMQRTRPPPMFPLPAAFARPGRAYPDVGSESRSPTGGRSR